MGLLRALLCATALSVTLHVPAQAAVETSTRHWQWPLSPDPVVVAAFRAPAQRWSPGHRGVDLLGSIGQPVMAIGAGTVSFAGVIAGRGVVVVGHGALRSTYQPVLASVRPGESVTAGDVLGTLVAVGSHCLPRVCLHLGVRRGADYLDPLSLLGSSEVRLKPLVGAAATSDAVGSVGTATRTTSRSGAPVGRTAPQPVADVAGTAGLAITAALATVAAERLRRRRSRSRHARG
jgi:peptidase M23-like protein